MRGLRVGERLGPRRRTAVAVTSLAVGCAGPFVDAWWGGHLVGSAASTVLVVVAAYLTGAWLRPAAAAPACLVGAGFLTAANQRAGSSYTAVDDAFFFAVLLGSAALAGALITARAGQVRELRRLTARRAQQRETEVRAAALEERNRLEAEVTRRMMQRVGAVLVQVSGARLSSDPSAIGRVEEAGRAALDDLRTTVGSLRTPERAEVVPDPVEPRAVVPPLGPVDVLVGLAGLPIAVEAASVVSYGTAALGALIGVPLLWRRRHPLASVAAVYVLALAFGAWVLPLAGLASPLVLLSLAAYAIGAHTLGRPLVAGVVLLVGGAGLVAINGPAVHHQGDGALPGLVWLTLAVLAGIATRRHETRANQQRLVLEALEAGRGADLRLAAAEQRQAVARDLHDTVAHAMTVVCLHAEAARRVDDVATALGVAEHAARGAMTQLRAGLVALEDEGAVAEGLWALAASLGVEIRLADSSASFGDAAGPARRVVREALVNAARHAPGVPVSVRLDRVVGGVRVEVTNPAPVRPPGYRAGSGTGLLGLEELVRAYGGAFERGPTSDGGFRVAASLPVRTAVPA